MTRPDFFADALALRMALEAEGWRFVSMRAHAPAVMTLRRGAEIMRRRVE